MNSQPKPQTNYVTLTDALLDAGLSEAGGWNKLQLRALGVSWPLKSGWRRKLIGTIVSRAEYERFLSLKGQTKAVRMEQEAQKLIPQSPFEARTEILRKAADELAYFLVGWIKEHQLSVSDFSKLITDQLNNPKMKKIGR